MFFLQTVTIDQKNNQGGDARKKRKGRQEGAVGNGIKSKRGKHLKNITYLNVTGDITDKNCRETQKKKNENRKKSFKDSGDRRKEIGKRYQRNAQKETDVKKKLDL